MGEASSRRSRPKSERSHRNTPVASQKDGTAPRARSAGRELDVGIRVEDAPDAEVELELEVLGVLGGVVQVDAIRRAYDGVPADAREERSEPVGVRGIPQEELHGPLVDLRSAGRRSA